MNFPIIYSSSGRLSQYCDFIEYCCFTNNTINFSEFDINDTSFTVEDVLKELSRRLLLYSPFRPFEINKKSIDSKLINSKELNYHYFYCLYYANIGGSTTIENTNLFELITDISLKNYFSTDKSIITSVGINTSLLIDKINVIVDHLKEDKGSDKNMPAQSKDGGIDIITYKPIDERGNQLICLTDATIGKNWESQKSVCTTVQTWSEYVHFKTSPLTCLSIVHVIEPEKFHHSSKMNGMIFDRVRIVKYFKENDTIQLELANWVKRLVS